MDHVDGEEKVPIVVVVLYHIFHKFVFLSASNVSYMGGTGIFTK